VTGEAAGSGADPGWWPALRRAGWASVPLFGLYINRFKARAVPGLVELRGIYLSISNSLVFFFVALWFVTRSDAWQTKGDRQFDWLVLVAGIGLSVGVGWVRRRPLGSDSPRQLADTYRVRSFIGLGLATSAALFGFTGTFVTRELFTYALGLMFALFGLWWIAPSRWNLAQDQERLTAHGSQLDLVRALMLQYPPAQDGSE